MMQFEYREARDAAEAVRLAAANPDVKYLGGGTNLVDPMRGDDRAPSGRDRCINLARQITFGGDGGVLIGAAAKNTTLAADRNIRSHFPMLSRALLSGASGQIRNMATVGGNIIAANALPLFLRRRGPMQQANAG